MKTLLPFPLVGLGAVAPAPPDFVPRTQARGKFALKAAADYFPPEAPNIRAHAKLALNASAFGRVKAPVEFAFKATAVWREPIGPSRARPKFALDARARPATQAKGKLALLTTAIWREPVLPVLVRARAKLTLNASARPATQAKAKLALQATAVWREPVVASRARGRLALNASARPAAQAPGKLALQATAVWREPVIASRVRGKLALNASARPATQAKGKLALQTAAVWRGLIFPSKPRVRLALNTFARAATQAKGKLSLQANAAWREPIIPSRARAKLALNANGRGPSIDVWPNGFEGQIEIRLDAVAGGLTVTNALMPIILTNPALKTASYIDENGELQGYDGLSQNNGLDVRFESAGGFPLGYVRLGYTANTGFWAGLVNLPSRNFAIDESIYLYIGKAATNGQDASLARAGGWLGWWGGAGTDLTGLGRHLVAHGGAVTNDTLDGLPAIRFDGVDDYLDQTDSSYLNGLSNFTAFQVYEPDFPNDELRELWNVAVGTAGELSYRFKSTARRIVAVAKFGASTFSLESADNTAPLYTGAPANWWDLPIRSGRPWASGTSFWSQTSMGAEEADVSLLDVCAGSSKGTSKANVATWDGVIGGAVGGALDDTGTQLDWATTTPFWFGAGAGWLPTGAAYPDGSGWLVWVMQTIPASESVSGPTDTAIWDAILAGTHDAKYVKFGERIVTKMAATGHPLKRLIIDANHEMNQSNPYQVFPGTRAKYKAAMERTIDKIRQGAGQYIRFMHRPGFTADTGDVKVGPYADWVPSTVDVLALSLHPNTSVNSDANVTKLFRGTLNVDWYGTDEVIAAGISLDKPVAFPEWSPHPEAATACPVANIFVRRFYDEVLAPNASRLVLDGCFSSYMRDPTAYAGGDAPGAAEWDTMVTTTRKTKWAGITAGVPVLLTAPTIAPASGVVVGTAVNVTSPGTWSGAPTSYAYQWQRGSGTTYSNVSTGISRTAAAADVGLNLRCQVIASNGSGASAPAFSDPTTAVTAAPGGVPVNTVLPTIAGTAQVGATLSCSTGSWSNTPTGYAYQWQRATSVSGTYSNITGAASSSMVVAPAQETEFIKCRVTASNGSGAGSPVLTAAVGPVTAASSSPFVVVYPSPFANTTGKTIKRPGVGGVKAFVTNGENNITVGSNEIWDLRGMVNTVHLNASSGSSFHFKNAPASAVACGGKSTSSNVRYFGTTAGAPWGSCRQTPALGGNCLVEWANANIQGVHGDTSTGGGASGNYASMYWEGPCQPGFRMHGFYCKRTIDGGVPKDDSNGCIIENSVFTEIRDDCLQGDSLNDVTFRGCYLQGHVIFSWRPGKSSGATPPKSGRIQTVENCLIHLDRQHYIGEDEMGTPGSKRIDKYISPSQRNNTIIDPYQAPLSNEFSGMGSKWLHKTYTWNDSGGMYIRYNMKNVLIRIDTPPVDGIENNPTGNTGEMFPKPGDGVGPGSTTGSSYDNVHIVFLAPNYNTTTTQSWDTVVGAKTGQTKAILAGWGITIHDITSAGGEQAAFDYWMTHYNAFMSAHAYDSVTDTFFHQRVP